MKRLISILVFIFMVTGAAAQERISGRVVDTEGNAVAGVAVVMQSVDSAYLDATSTLGDGTFSLPLSKRPYRLMFQHIMHNVQGEIYSGSQVGDVVLEEKANRMDAVVVNGEKPLVTVKEGKLSYDIETVTSGKVVSTAYDALLQLPGVGEQDGALTLAGASGVTVIINGKPTTLSSEQLVMALRSIPVSRVESAEVMYSTPPQYHVRGASINVVLKQENTESGSKLQGEINAALSQRHYTGYSAGGSLVYSGRRLSADALYSVRDGEHRTGLDIASKHTLSEVVHDIEQHNRGTAEGLAHNIRLGMDYKMGQKGNVSLVYTGELNPGNENFDSSTGNFSSATNKREAKKTLHNVALDVTTGFGLKGGVNYTYYDSPGTQHFHNTDNDANVTDFTAWSGQRIDRVMAYADQEHAIGQGGVSIRYGGELTYARDKDFQRYSAPGYLDTDNTLHEYTAGMYAGVNAQLAPKLSMSVDVAGEFFKMADYEKWSVYPTATMTYVGSPANIVQFSFSSDKTYPSYWEVQNSVGYLNGYAELHGNPSLKPSREYSAQLTYIFKSKYMFTLYGSSRPDYSAQLAYQAPDRLVLIYQTQNWDYMRTYGVNVVIPFRLGKLVSSRLTLNGFCNHSKSSHFHDISFDRKRWLGYANLTNTFNVSSKPDVKFELTGFAMTSPIQGIYDLSSLCSVDAGVKWTFAEGKAELRAKGSDIFDSRTPDVKIRTAGQHLDMVVLPDSRIFSLSMSYRFGGYKTKERKEVDSSRFGH